MKKKLTVFIIVIIFGCGYYIFKYPYTILEKTPFTKITWENDKIFVNVEGKYYQWLEAEGFSVKQIQGFAKKKYAHRWQHRITSDYIMTMKDMGIWVFFSTYLKLKDEKGNIIEKSFPMSLENRQKAMKNEKNQQTVKRKHTSIIPDSLKYIIQRVDGYQPKKDVLSTKSRQNSIDDNISLSMDSWITRDKAIEDLESLEYEIKNNFSYADLNKINYSIVIDAIIHDLKDGISKRDLGIQIKRFLSLFGDGHTRVSRSMLKIDSLFLPFQVDKLENRYIALSDNDFYNPDYPEIVSIDNNCIDTLKGKAGEMVAKGSSQFYDNECLKYLFYYGFLQKQMNNKNDIIEVKLTNGNDTITQITKLVNLDSVRKIFKSIPKQSQHKLLDDNIGYIYLHKMEGEDDYQVWLRKTMNEFKNTNGLIIDIRGNGGGSRIPTYTLLPYFIQSPKVINVSALRIDREIDPDINEPIGDLESRMSYPQNSSHWTSEERNTIESFKQSFVTEWDFDKEKFSKWHYSVVSPNKEYYNKPVVILMDERNFSASDIFLGAFKGEEKVTLIGSKSGGGSGFAKVKFLNNSGLMYLLSHMISFQPNGKLYDGNGIVPDVEIKYTLNDIKINKDVALTKAMHFISKR